MVFLPDELRQHVHPPDPALLFRRDDDPTDQRLGELLLPSVPPEPPFDALLLGIPQDLGVVRNHGRPGAAAAPDAIRSALYRLTPDTTSDRGLESLRILDVGNLATAGKTLEEIHALQERCVAALLRLSTCVIVLGGGHDIAYPNAAALVQSGDCGILVFDAHPDVRPRINGGAHSGSSFRQLLEERAFPAHRLAYIGLQPFSIARSHREYLQQRGAHVVFLSEVRARGIETIVPALFDTVSAGGTLPVYVSLDMDVLPAAFAPGVSAPAVVGILPEELLWAVHFLGAQPAVRLLDIAELNPRYDVDNRTARLAARMIATFLSGLLQRPR